MGKKLEERLLKLGEALLKVVYENPPPGISIPYIHICLSCGRVEEVIEYLNDPSRWVAGRDDGSDGGEG